MQVAALDSSYCQQQSFLCDLDPWSLLVLITWHPMEKQNVYFLCYSVLLLLPIPMTWQLLFHKCKHPKYPTEGTVNRSSVKCDNRTPPQLGSNNCCTLGVTNSKLHQSFPISQLSFYSFSSFFSLLWSITIIKVQDWKVCWCLNKVNLAVVSQNPVLDNPQCSWTFFLNVCFCEQCKEGQKLTVERLLFY